jgi:hypothetical protein
LDALDKKEFDRYVNMCSNGTIYAQLIKASGNVLNKSTAKKLMFRVLFGKNKVNCKENKFFKRCFPTIWAFIKSYKKIKGTYKSLSHELQRKESQLIYGKIVQEIKSKYPGIKMFTVHDSIIYPVYFKKMVEEIFNAHVKTAFSFD